MVYLVGFSRNSDDIGVSGPRCDQLLLLPVAPSNPHGDGLGVCEADDGELIAKTDTPIVVHP